MLPTQRAHRRPGPNVDPAPAAHDPRRHPAPPARTRRLVRPQRTNRAWPVTIVMIAVLVFVVARSQTTLLLALTATIAVLAGAVAVHSVTRQATSAVGPFRLTWLRRLVSRDRD